MRDPKLAHILVFVAGSDAVKIEVIRRTTSSDL